MIHECLGPGRSLSVVIFGETVYCLCRVREHGYAATGIEVSDESFHKMCAIPDKILGLIHNKMFHVLKFILHCIVGTD